MSFWMVLLPALFRSGVMAFLGPAMWWKIICIWKNEGATMNTLCSVAALRYPKQMAIIDDNNTITYEDLCRQTISIAQGLYQNFGVKNGSSVGVMCRNHSELIKALLALSRLGADILLLNTQMPAIQLQQTFANINFQMFIFDEELEDVVSASGFKGTKIIAQHINQTDGNLIHSLTAIHPTEYTCLPKPRKASNITILTSGTSGLPKGAMRKPSVYAMLLPFLTLLVKLPLRPKSKCMISVPVFHGFGLAAIALSIATGNTMILNRKFDIYKTISQLQSHKAEYWVVIPLMLKRLMNNAASLQLNSLKAVISGAAPLPPLLLAAFTRQFGNKLYNMYGTSEAGIISMATPADLLQYPETVGRPSQGVHLKITDGKKNKLMPNQTGHVCIKGLLVFDSYLSDDKNKSSTQWYNTGDAGYLNKEGYLFLQGRTDSMIISGGENIYPVEIENLLKAHPLVSDAVVTSIPDDEFGQCLIAFVQLLNDANTTEVMLKNYLKERTASYKIPRRITVVSQIPVNEMGKVSYGALQAMVVT